MAAETQEINQQVEAEQQAPAISLADIHDPNGVTLVGEADEAIQRAELLPEFTVIRGAIS